MSEQVISISITSTHVGKEGYGEDNNNIQNEALKLLHNTLANLANISSFQYQITLKLIGCFKLLSLGCICYLLL